MSGMSSKRTSHPIVGTVAIVVTVSLLAASRVSAQGMPPGESGAKAALEKSPRHGEYVDIDVSGRDAPLRAYVVYPETKESAPVVIVVHEIFGLTDWIRSVADQLAAEGFIAIAPDYITGKGVEDGPDGPPREAAVAAIRALSQEEVQGRTDAVARYGMALPAAAQKYGIVGFCWGGST